MSEEQFRPSEQDLIQRLRDAPQKQLSPRIAEAIQAKMLAEFSQPGTIPPLQVAGSPLKSLPFAAALASLLGLSLLVGVLAASANQGEPPATPVPTLAPSATELIPSATASPSVTPSATASLSSTPTPTLTASPTASLSPSPTATPEIVVIEGPVQAIEADIITVNDLEVVIQPGDAVDLRVGDTVRVEVEVQPDAGLIEFRSLILIERPATATPTVQSAGGSAGSPPVEDEDCKNPPPDWAAAHGWRARCEGQPRPGSSGVNPGGSPPQNNPGRGQGNNPGNNSGGNPGNNPGRGQGRP